MQQESPKINGLSSSEYKRRAQIDVFQKWLSTKWLLASLEREKCKQQGEAETYGKNTKGLEMNMQESKEKKKVQWSPS